MTEIINKDGEKVISWSCILTVDEMNLLAEGIDPTLIHPDKLIYYAPLPYQEHIRDEAK